MAHSIGGFIGGLIGALLFIRLIRWVFGMVGLSDPIARAALPPILFLAFATVVGGRHVVSGVATGLWPAFLTYLAPTVVAAVVYILVDAVMRARRGADD